jgi:hypothetical protein
MLWRASLGKGRAHNEFYNVGCVKMCIYIYIYIYIYILSGAYDGRDSLCVSIQVESQSAQVNSHLVVASLV